jgi:hypothetical protein
MNVNDFMSFDIQTAYRHHILMPVEVKYVDIDIGWKKQKENPESVKVKDMEVIWASMHVKKPSTQGTQNRPELRGKNGV